MIARSRWWAQRQMSHRAANFFFHEARARKIAIVPVITSSLGFVHGQTFQSAVRGGGKTDRVTVRQSSLYSR
jgi:hypothetical protein